MNLAKVLFALMCAVFLFASAHGCCCCCPCCCRCRHHYLRHQLLGPQRHIHQGHVSAGKTPAAGDAVVAVLRGKLRHAESARVESTQTARDEQENNETVKREKVTTKEAKN